MVCVLSKNKTMNIFALDINPQISAQYHCDKHVVKMILESAQIISTVFARYDEHKPYMLKSCFEKHPCTIWAGNDIHNLRYVIGLGYFLVKEYKKRYDKFHKYHGLFHDFMKDMYLLTDKIPNIKLQPFYLAVPDYLKSKISNDYSLEDAVNVYREYYNFEKSKFAKWKNVEQPIWYINKYINES